MKLYKLTDKNWETYNHTKWGPGVTHRARPGKGNLCSPYYIHAYTDPWIAILTNPIHANIKNPVLWEARGRVVLSDGLMVGGKTITTINIIEAPSFKLEDCVCFAIFCAKQVYHDSRWNKWADDYLSDKDRSEKAALAAREEAAAAASWTPLAVADETIQKALADFRTYMEEK